MARRKPKAADVLETLRQGRVVRHPIASEVWTFKDPSRRKRRAQIDVGKPQRIPRDKNGDWFCPVRIEGWTGRGIMPAVGVGPLDSLMNALTLVRGFRGHVGGMHITSNRGSRHRKP
jgi:hypothetical protein